jgi:hypothetical protein
MPVFHIPSSFNGISYSVFSVYSKTNNLDSSWFNIWLQMNRIGKCDNQICRCVDSRRESNGKKKGENNRKNGNRYLAWAYIEAANFAIRRSESAKRYYQKKAQQTNEIVARKALAHKLARASYWIMKKRQPFDETLIFG